VKNEWTEEYIEKYLEYAVVRGREYLEAKINITCEDFNLAVIIDFAHENALPLVIVNGSGYYSASDPRYDNFDDFKHQILKTTGVRDLQRESNTVAVSPVVSPQPGDLIINRNKSLVANHTQLISSVARGPNEGDQITVISILQGTGGHLDSDWARMFRISGLLNVSDPHSAYYTGLPVQEAQYDVTGDFYVNFATDKRYTRFSAVAHPEFRSWNFYGWNPKTSAEPANLFDIRLYRGF